MAAEAILPESSGEAWTTRVVTSGLIPPVLQREIGAGAGPNHRLSVFSRSAGASAHTCLTPKQEWIKRNLSERNPQPRQLMK